MEPHFYKTTIFSQDGESSVSGFWWPENNTPLLVMDEPDPPKEAMKENCHPPHTPYKKLADSSKSKMLERLASGLPTTKEWEPVAALMWERGILGYSSVGGYYLIDPLASPAI